MSSFQDVFFFVFNYSFFLVCSFLFNHLFPTSSSHFHHSQPPSFVWRPASFSSVSPQLLVICLNWGSNRTLTVQDCRQLVCVRVHLHRCSSHTDIVLNLSPKCTQKNYCEAQRCEINYSELEGEADFQSTSRFHKAKFKELFNATWTWI